MTTNKKRAVSLIAASMFFSVIGPIFPVNAASQQLVVDITENTGDIRYGASGFLYGLGSEGVPTANVLAPLRPQAIAQKAPDGAQHPNGDALKVAPELAAAGGREIQIYMQDVYPNWPYDNLGLNDYLGKIDTMMQKVMTDPNRSLFVYVPFNEPDGNWYQGMVDHSKPKSYDEPEREAKRQQFFADWKTVYEHIKSIDSGARIAGPNLSVYSERFHEDFFAYAKQHDVLPDVMTWHELGNDFFSDWYTHYDHYRQLEEQLDIDERQISINEYARPEWGGADLGNPGQLVQWMTRLENSKVDGMLAYWTAAGTLNDLVTANNKATGGWWLYKWYGELTGHTVSVTPPTLTGPLQGLAALDETKKQVRVLFGGSYPEDVYATDVTVKGLDKISDLGSTVHATVWGVDDSATKPSDGPYLVHEGDYTVSNGRIIVPLSNLKAHSAYQLIVTPGTDHTSADLPERYEAEYAKIKDQSIIRYGNSDGYSGTGYVTADKGGKVTTEFVMNAPTNGYYDLNLRYAIAADKPVEEQHLDLHVNEQQLTSVSVSTYGEENTWNTSTTTVFLMAGINRIEYSSTQANNSESSILIDYMESSAATGDVTTYEAEDDHNTLNGTAVVENESAASGGKYVGWIGEGADNTLQFNNVSVPQTGLYRMVITFANAEVVGDHTYNNNVVDRLAHIEINGQKTQSRYFHNTRAWNRFETITFDVQLQAGENTIQFANADGFVPNIDKIEIAAALKPKLAPATDTDFPASN